MLDELAIRYGTDKSSQYHDYCGVYERCFEHLRDVPIVLLELGIGGYEYPDRGGESLRMWQAYFSRAKIVGVDIHPKTGMAGDRIVTCMADVTNASAMQRVISAHGTPTIILDDASHYNAPHIAAFRVLWPHLAPGGFYVIEDTESCYWVESTLGKHPRAFDTPTTMNFAFGLCHDANRGLPGNEPIEFPDVASVRFHRGLIIMEKAS